MEQNINCIQQPCSYPGNGGAATVLFASLVSSVLNSQCTLGNPNDYPRDVAQFLPEYDFIVIGGGSAGSVVASRLSEVAKWNVLLLEAGDNPSMASDIPALTGLAQHTREDWELWTEPDGQACLGMKDGRCFWPRGKVLGGTSVLNAMLYVRGNKKDYDEWEQMGNTGWGYEEVLKYFKKSQNAEEENEFHATGGLLNTKQFAVPEVKVIPLLKMGAKETGYDFKDVNGESQVGYGDVPSTQRNNERLSTAKAFLSPAKDRVNLHVSKNSHVIKLRVID